MVRGALHEALELAGGGGGEGRGGAAREGAHLVPAAQEAGEELLADVPCGAGYEDEHGAGLGVRNR